MKALSRKSEPVSLGSCMQISFAELTDSDGKIEWDTLGPESQPRRGVDGSRTENRSGWKGEAPIGYGHRDTTVWYENIQRVIVDTGG